MRKDVLRKRALLCLGGLAGLLLPACGPAPERHIAAAPLTRYGQVFEITVVASTAQDCRIRSRLPEPYSAGAWIDVRNSAVHAARIAAETCCARPRVDRISDWMAGFAAWEIRFTCQTEVKGSPKRSFPHRSGIDSTPASRSAEPHPR